MAEANVQNQPYDEAVELSDSESVDGPDTAGSGRDLGHSTGGDDDFEFGDEFSSRDDGSPVKPGAGKPQVVTNQPHDEAVDVSDSSSVDDSATPQNKSPVKSPPTAGAQSSSNEYNSSDDSGGDEEEDGSKQGDDKSDDEGSESSSSEDDEGGGGPTAGYNPAEYAHLQVSTEIKELFDYIGRHKPQAVELLTSLKPFIPDYIPAVGEIDAFLKIQRPDGKPDTLGLSVLDEPGPIQTDGTVLDLQLRAISKHSNLQPMAVASIENAANNPKAITAWIQSINELHRSKPPPNVNYTRPMPDIEALMQVWPQEMEEALNEHQLPTAELDVDVKAYTRIICSLLDIPVYQNLTESLHVLFTLYSVFKNNQHFNESDGMAMGRPAVPLGPM
eukprot:CAMPEP_0114554624 /NCGR_PEP_ID=MMETSP0114-20121206/8310_1 /TAXON_ID=31324 /ORGANISM="Goniomonas sp, Strain m" /LENGTH=387 /DNA_ID=CAMNT_0001739685 /DNA_START=30 /DNA_END=1193 /DNA_ORIENTATION=+